MRFTTAWAEIASQNVTLKVSIALLTLICATLAITATKLALRDPLIVERGCETTAASLGSADTSEAEIRAFTERALEQRFASISRDTHFLSSKELEFRKREQEALSSKGILQRLLINEIKVEKEKIFVDSDRIVSVQKIRSAFSFPLIVQLSKVPRTVTNPYGLILASVEQVKTDEEKK